jgi:hypothetical protein
MRYRTCTRNVFGVGTAGASGVSPGGTGVSGTSNFTWGRALGTGTTSQATSSNTAIDVFNLQNNYGPQSFDIKFLYNLGLFYTPKWYASQKGILGHILGGWNFSPLLTAQSGNPLAVTYNDSGSKTRQQAFGEVSTTSAQPGGSNITEGRAGNPTCPLSLTMFSSVGTCAHPATRVAVATPKQDRRCARRSPVAGQTLSTCAWPTVSVTK